LEDKRASPRLRSKTLLLDFDPHSVFDRNLDNHYSNINIFSIE